MKKVFNKILFIVAFIALSVSCIAQTADLEKVFDKYGNKRHFAKIEYGSQKPLWLNLIAHNASFVKILSCDAKQTSRKYKKFNRELDKSTKDFNIIFEFNDNNHGLKVLASEKDDKECMNFVIVNSLGEREKVIWLYGRTNIKRFIDYLRENLSLI